MQWKRYFWPVVGCAAVVFSLWLLYHEVRALLQGVATKGRVVGFDVVEVNPMLDLHGQTSLLTTTMIAEFLGAIFDQPR